VGTSLFPINNQETFGGQSKMVGVRSGWEKWWVCLLGVKNGLRQKCRVRSSLPDHLPAQAPPVRAFLCLPPTLCPLSFFVLASENFLKPSKGGIFFDFLFLGFYFRGYLVSCLFIFSLNKAKKDLFLSIKNIYLIALFYKLFSCKKMHFFYFHSCKSIRNNYIC
jgi:hypothetical protein